ncbi:ribosomal protein 63, mitochondrial [Eublepharis macularius]|uniref:Ribosomal protein 63, mitochondrial n=1 Tax=Eublepharis macularius TaxID=481883 RepID=A0AA97J2M2_EUBMA|nr:ribosomal protein 63, mitochondrial [Eublepharis macularius]
MFLTVALLRNKIPGRQWIGKHRRPRMVTYQMKCNMIRRLEIEAENEYWLSQPYMTQEQEYRHNEENRRAKRQELMAALSSKFPEHRYATEHLNHLNVSKKWETS